MHSVNSAVQDRHSGASTLPPASSEPLSASAPKLFFPNLDGLRFFCFLAVFFFHAFSADLEVIKADPVWNFVKLRLFGNGSLGVSFFFVLSGYLITTLLLAEKAYAGKINVPMFYLRRVLRIWPLFYACVAFGFLVFPLLKSALGQPGHEPANPLSFIFFFNNIDAIRIRPDSSLLSVLWSVAVEEQFYIFWPLLIAFVPERWLTPTFWGIIGGSFVFRALNAHQPLVLHFHTFSCIGDMAFGGWAALLTRAPDSPVRQWIRNLSRPSLMLLYAALAALLLFRAELFESVAVLIPFDRLVCALVFALVILEQNYAERSLFKMSNFPRLSRLGQLTYGLYCLHFVGLLASMIILKKLGLNQTLWHEMLLDPALSLAIAIGVAWLSYRFFESPFLRLKDRFAVITKGRKEGLPR
jgi:peptidoglycan/LPS O-acetylase OafA/YrhL